MYKSLRTLQNHGRNPSEVCRSIRAARDNVEPTFDRPIAASPASHASHASPAYPAYPAYPAQADLSHTRAGEPDNVSRMFDGIVSQCNMLDSDPRFSSDAKVQQATDVINRIPYADLGKLARFVSIDTLERDEKVRYNKEKLSNSFGRFSLDEIHRNLHNHTRTF
jgi:hypothetical protein